MECMVSFDSFRSVSCHFLDITGIMYAQVITYAGRMRQFALGRPDLSGEIQKRYRNETDVRSRAGLLCVKLAATGEYTSKEVSKICGKSQSSIFVCFKAFRERGFEGLLGGKSRYLERGHFAAYPLPSWSNSEKGWKAGVGRQQRRYAAG